MSDSIRADLVRITLEWEKLYGVAPMITSVISENDAALLIGFSPEEYQLSMQGVTSDRKGYDFEFNGIRYQIKANRPSGKSGSFVTLVAKPRNYEWDLLIWILYNSLYEIQETWLWDVDSYKLKFDSLSRLSPNHMRLGHSLLNS